MGKGFLRYALVSRVTLRGGVVVIPGVMADAGAPAVTRSDGTAAGFQGAANLYQSYKANIIQMFIGLC